MNSYISAELNDLGVFRTTQFKRISILKPVIGNFDLKSVFDLLTEHSVSIADTASVCTVSKSSKRVEEAGRKSAKTAVSKRGISFLIFYKIDIDAHFVKRFRNFLVFLQVDHCISKSSTHKEFHGQIVNCFRILLLVCLLSFKPVIDNRILYRIGNGLIYLLLVCLFKSLPEKCLNIFLDLLLKRFLVKCDLACCHQTTS